MELELERSLAAGPGGAVDQPAVVVAHQREAARQDALIAEAGEQAAQRTQPLAGIAQAAPTRLVLAQAQVRHQPPVARQALAQLVEAEPPAEPRQLAVRSRSSERNR